VANGYWLRFRHAVIAVAEKDFFAKPSILMTRKKLSRSERDKAQKLRSEAHS
jgi:hypothetical protein